MSLTRDALIALAAEFGDVEPRQWLVNQGLLDRESASSLSDGAIMFFAAGVMSERTRRNRSN